MTLGIRWSREVITRRKGAIWIMVGRPRKVGKRQPNGQLVRVYQNPKAQVAAQPHRSGVLAKYREWPEAESEFGRLMLRGIITPAQYEAGRLYAGLADSYRAVWGIPRLHPCSADLINVGASESPGMASEHARTIQGRYDRAFEECVKAGHRAVLAVKDHAIFERKVSDFATLDALKNGLDRLVGHFNINPDLSIDRKVQITDSRT